MSRHLPIFAAAPADATDSFADLGDDLPARVASTDGAATGTGTPPPLMLSEEGSFRFRSKTEMRIQRKVTEAVRTWRLLDEGDRVMVCISGGKDSYALLDMMLLMQRRIALRFTLVAVNVDQGWPGYDTARIAEHLRERGVEYRMVNAESIARIVEEKLAPDATPCSLCSRLRRGVLYNLAVEMGCTKIALGHHLDDTIETLMMNLFFSGQLRAMPPRLVSDDGRNVVIRPMTFVEEKDLIAYAGERSYPVVRCGCPTCGLPEQQRQVTKRWLSALEAEHPRIKTTILAAMQNVRAGHLFDQGLIERLASPSVAASAPHAPTGSTAVSSSGGLPS